MTKKPFIQKGFKLFLAFIMFLGILFQNSHITFAERGTEVNRTEVNRTENKSTENKGTENKSTENKSTENKSTENKSTAANGASDKGTEENLANLIKNKAAEVKGAEANKTKVTITRFEIKDKEGNPIPPGKEHGYWSKYRLEMDWDASMYKKGELKEGDYFVITLPKQFKFPTEGSAVHFPLYAPDKQTIVAWADVNSEGEAGGGTVKVTFTNYVNNRENIKGDMFLEATLAHKNINAGGSNKIIISIGGIQTSVDISIEPKPTLDNEVLGKWGEKITGNENQAQWRMRINHKKGHFSNLVIKDELFVSSGALPSGIHYIPETFELKEVEMNAYGEGQKVINTYNYEKLKQHITFSAKETKFEFRFSNMLGNTEGKQFILSYKSTYIPQLKLQNKATFDSKEHNTKTESYWMNSQAGGGGQGDLTQKIKIFKVDENNDSIKLANAKFKVTKVADGSTFELITNSQGEAVSEKLAPGKYLVKETEAPNGYVLDGKVYEVTVIAGEALLLTVKNSKEIEISGEKTWDDNNDQDGKRPTKLTVILKKKVGGQTSEVKRQDVTPDSDGKWKYKFDKLPKYENGKLIEYSIDEEKVAGYDKVTTRTTNGPDYNLKNTHKPEKRTIEGQKIWNDNNNQDGKRPTSIKVKLYKKVGNNNQEYVTEKVVTEGADKAWKWKFENLDKYENKQEIQYTVEEEVTNGYAGVVTGSMAAGFKITNSYTPETVNISGEKTWDDNNNQDGKRPESITVKLMKQVEGGQPEVKETKVVREGTDKKWKYEFNNLPRYENGKLITYSIDEEAVTGYKKEVTGYNLKNSYTPGKTKVQVTKAWEDKDNQDGVRPASVKVKLLADGVEVPGKTLTLTATNNWTGSFADLDEYKAGKKIVYTVKEEEVGNGYDSKVIGSPEDGFKVINTRQTEKVNVEGTKTWNDADNQDGKRPTEIKINLLKNGTVVETKTVTEKDGWKWKFENLDKYANGEVINYTITEEAVENGYTSEITKTGENTFTVKNTREPEKTFVEGTKTWDDANNQDGKRPTKIKVTLYKKPIVLPRGEDDGRIKVAEKEVTQADDWKWKFENLDKYEAGQPIEYFVTEDPVEGYTTEINKVGKEDGRVEFNIVNKHLPEKAVVSGTKTWVDNNDQAGKRPGSIKVILNKTVDGKTTKVAEKEVTAKDNWNYAFNDLPKYENGKLIEYSIDEVDVPGYEKTIKGYNLENKYIPKKPGLPKTGSAPSEVGGLGVLGLLAGYVLIRRKNKAN